MTGVGSRTPVTPALAAKARKLRDQGLTLAVIGERLGLTKRTLQKVMAREPKRVDIPRDDAGCGV